MLALSKAAVGPEWEKSGSSCLDSLSEVEETWDMWDEVRGVPQLLPGAT